MHDPLFIMHIRPENYYSILLYFEREKREKKYANAFDDNV